MYGSNIASLHKILSYDHENANESFSQLCFHKVLFIYYIALNFESETLWCHL